MTRRPHPQRQAIRACLLAGMLLAACSAPPTGTAPDRGDTLVVELPGDTLAPPRWPGVLLFEGPDASIVTSDLSSGMTTTIGTGRSPAALPAAGHVDGIGLADGLVLIDSAARYLMIQRGGSREILFDGTDILTLFDARVAPDAERIAVTQLEPRTLRPRVRIVARDGRLLATVDDAASPAWLRDGRLVVAGSYRYPYVTDAPIATPAEDGLFIVDSALTSVQRIRVDFAHALDPAMSPDGGRVAFALDGDIWMVNTNGEQLRRVTSGSRRESHPVWSPDGAHIACISSDPATSSGTIAIIDAAASAATPINDAKPIWPGGGVGPERLRAVGSLSWR